jgi:GTP-binding protein YchF
LKIGIYGAPYSGKTTIFKLLVGDVNEEIGIAKVPDERVDFLSSIYEPKKTTYATMEFVDLPGLSPELPRKEKNQILSKIQNVDALLWVIRAFEDESVPRYFDDAAKESEYLHDELLIRDLEIAETNIEKLKNAKKKLSREEEHQLQALEKCEKALNDGKFVKLIELSEDEKKALSSFGFFTMKESIVVVNLDEESFRSKNYAGKEKIEEIVNENSLAMMEMCGKLEMEINELEEDERKEFLNDLGLKESGIDRLAKVVYSSLGLISFFTVGKDEVRAWTIKKGTNFKKAAGKIHTDIERGFIRAEVVKYSDMKELGSMKEIKAKGLMKLEGKESIVEDGDIVNIRFNV